MHIPFVRPADETQDVRLMEAARSGDALRVNALIEAGVDPNDADARGVTPLIFAAMAGSVDVVRQLLAAGADPSRLDRDGYDACHAAMMYGDFKGVVLSPFDDVLRVLRGIGSRGA